jgi:hypothetical protein
VCLMWLLTRRVVIVLASFDMRAAVVLTALVNVDLGLFRVKDSDFATLEFCGSGPWE